MFQRLFYFSVLKKPHLANNLILPTVAPNAMPGSFTFYIDFFYNYNDKLNQAPASC
jgi:hypothetical protein